VAVARTPVSLASQKLFRLWGSQELVQRGLPQAGCVGVRVAQLSSFGSDGISLCRRFFGTCCLTSSEWCLPGFPIG